MWLITAVCPSLVISGVTMAEIVLHYFLRFQKWLNVFDHTCNDLSRWMLYPSERIQWYTFFWGVAVKPSEWNPPLAPSVSLLINLQTGLCLLSRFNVANSQEIAFYYQCEIMMLFIFKCLGAYCKCHFSPVILASLESLITLMSSKGTKQGVSKCHRAFNLTFWLPRINIVILVHL